MNKEAINDLKWNYNKNLARYNNGCNYCELHRKEIDKWLPELVNILDNIDILLKEITKYKKVSQKEIVEGFDICKQ